MSETVDVLLIHPPYHRRAGSGVIPPIGLAYVGSALEQVGYRVAILDCAVDCGSQSHDGLMQFQAFLQERLKNIDPTLCIGLGPTTTPALKSLYVLSEFLDKRYSGIPTIYGGPFASMKDQVPLFFEILRADALVRGEAEEVLPDLIQAMVSGNTGIEIPGVVWNPGDKTPVALVRDINSLAFPARHLLDNNRYKPSLRRNIFQGPITAIYLSRGCPYHCAFCVSPLLRGNRVARRDNSNFFDEMKTCIERFGISGFICYDDCLFLKSRNLNDQVHASALK